QDLYLDIILESEQFVRAGVCETCQSAEAIFSCSTCTGDHGWCRPCMIKSHRSLPFHKIQLWIGRCFKDVALADQGFIWYLGHSGESCPRYAASNICGREVEGLPCDTTPITIVHSSGVFMHNIAWCHCQGSNPQQHLQLLRAGLFPASSTRPKTAFTFEVLDHFLIDALECKTSARSFFEKLTRLTNNAFPDTVPDRYRELMRVSRLWRDLKNRKWFGFGHDVESGPGPGDLALFCPSCPQPGINMSLLWEQKWLVMRRLVVDGNFTAQHMNMREPELDICLSDGSGYMVTDAEYQAHLASAMESKERSTCSNHRAVNTANANRSNLRATGVGATACARHGCFVPHSIVDFQKGERQVFFNLLCDGLIHMNMDYSICKAIKHAANAIDTSLVIYDVGCQWNLHFTERVDNCSGLTLPDNTEIVAAVGKFHLSAHKLACFARYSLNFIIRAGQKQAMEQRGEHLDIYLLKIDKGEFSRASARFDVHSDRFLEAPTMAEMRLKLTETEYANTGKLGSVSWLMDGINLEDAQDGLRVDIRQLPRDASATQKAVVAEKRQKLAARISKYHEKTDAMTEGIEVNSVTVPMDDIRFCTAETEELGQEVVDVEFASEEIAEEVPAEVMGIWMPSSMPHQDGLALGLGALQTQELQLRQGQANDCLERLRQALGHKAIIYRQHFRSADSTWVGTRSKQEAFRCRIKIDKCVRSYQRARNAMQRLGVDEEILRNVYQEILPSQLTVNQEVTEENRYGQGSDRLAWFWRVNNGGDTHEDAWMDEFYRVNWLKAKARWQRWEEELSLVRHEMGWTVSWFGHKKDEWDRRYDQATKLGHQAYAQCQVLLWERFLLDAENSFKDKMIVVT
ncbi:hypothetical protein F4604DRAFT_1597863, partial [Suillus subluteus]